jgi:hypothetical protein
MNNSKKIGKRQLDRLEKQIQAELQNVFCLLGINAVCKVRPKSLPFTRKLVAKIIINDWDCAIQDRKDFIRLVIFEILKIGILYLKFYIKIESGEQLPDGGRIFYYNFRFRPRFSKRGFSVEPENLRVYSN